MQADCGKFFLKLLRKTAQRGKNGFSKRRRALLPYHAVIRHGDRPRFAADRWNGSTEMTLLDYQSYLAPTS